VLRQRLTFGLQALLILALPFVLFRLDPPSPVLWSLGALLIALIFAVIHSSWAWFIPGAVGLSSAPSLMDLGRSTIPFLWGCIAVSLGVLIAVTWLQPMREPAMFRPQTASRRPIVLALSSVLVAALALAAFALFLNRSTDDLLGSGSASDPFADAPMTVRGSDDGTSPVMNIPALLQPNTSGAGPVIATLEFRRADGRSVVSRDPIYIRDGVDVPTLAVGPGRYPQAAEPGAIGNLAIAGHRTAFSAPFNELERLAPGDAITVQDATGASFTYEVVISQVVRPDDLWVVGPDPLNIAAPTLTLTTADPPGRTDQRLVILAALRSSTPAE
jgi:LPXTG-site transpeptidase (sortase) family protein